MENKKLYIVRGLPGSGKSTFAENLVGSDFLVCEVDKYFNDKDGGYNFDFTKLKEAHKWCQDRVGNAMILNITANLNNVIVVSNTFTQEWEMQPYFDMAENFDYKVFSVIVENRHGGINQHGVPEDKIELMRNRFEIKL